MSSPKQVVVCFGLSGTKAANQPVLLESNYAAAVDRVRTTLKASGYEGDFWAWETEYPAGCPSHQEAPFAFKPFCFLEAVAQGYEQILWVDASIIVRRNLAPLFQWMEHHGYVIFKEDHSLGEYCSDAALEPLEIGREESFEMPCCWATVIGLDVRNPKARSFLSQWHALAIDGKTFPGPKWSGVFGWPRTASADPRVKGHRHDQTAASVVATKLGMDRWLSKEDFAVYFENDRFFARTYHEEWHGLGRGTDGVLRLLRDSEIQRAARP